MDQQNKKANWLCIISLASTFLPTVITAIVMSVVSAITGSEYSSVADFVMNILASLVLLGIIAGIALMIYVRVKYPRNTFGKVLMWLYIVIAILSAIVILIVLLSNLVYEIPYIRYGIFVVLMGLCLVFKDKITATLKELRSR